MIQRHYGYYYLTIDGEEGTHATYNPTGGAPLCQPDTVTPDPRKVEETGELTCRKCMRLLARSWRRGLTDGSIRGESISYFDYEENAQIVISDVEYVFVPSGQFVRFWMRGGRFPRKCFYRLARLIYILVKGNAYVLPDPGTDNLH
jgi:hypothetical protein